MKHIITALLLTLASTATFAVEWVCSTSQATRVAIAAADRGDDFALAQAPNKKPPRFRIDRLDLIQAYSGQPVLLNRQWLLVVMLPADHPDTRVAFAELGVSPQAAERMATDSGLVDRGIRVVQTPDQLIHKVGINPPAVGFTSFFIGSRDVAPCF
jgi:hypothetical protein